MAFTKNTQNTFGAVPSILAAGPKKSVAASPEMPADTFFSAHRGTSMNPTLSRLDILEILPYKARKPQLGDVVFFLPPSHDDYFVHRIVLVGDSFFLTKGDNNTKIDTWTLRNNDIYGRVIAAHKGNKRRVILNGFPGRFVEKFCHFRKFFSRLIARLLGPAYRSLCSDGFLHWIIPYRFIPRVVTFHSDSDSSHQLLLGKRIIGFYDCTLLQWQIRRPFRVLVDESSLPTPR